MIRIEVGAANLRKGLILVCGSDRAISKENQRWT